MYTPKPYVEADLTILQASIRAWSFGTLVTVSASGVQATHLPFLLNTLPDDAGSNPSDEVGRQGVLRTHLSKRNPQYLDLCEGGEVLAIFQGPHAFITPSWYVKQSTFPTWNYTAIHARGRPRMVEDRAALYALMRSTVEQYATPLGGSWDFDTMPFEFVAPRLDMIAGVEIPIHTLEGTFKLNQDRSEDDRRGVVEALEALGDPQGLAVAALMREQIARTASAANADASSGAGRHG